MTQVYARQRTETLTGYVVIASKIRIEVLRLIKRETVLPKSLRFLVGKDITSHAESLEREAEHAYAWYPSDEMRLAERSSITTPGARYRAWTLIISSSKFRRVQQGQNTESMILSVRNRPRNPNLSENARL